MPPLECLVDKIMGAAGSAPENERRLMCRQHVMRLTGTAVEKQSTVSVRHRRIGRVMAQRWILSLSRWTMAVMLTMAVGLPGSGLVERPPMIIPQRLRHTVHPLGLWEIRT